MTIERAAVRILIAAAGIIALAVVVVALTDDAGRDPAGWAAVAAALAVFAAIVSAYSGQRLMEMQEDALEPRLYLGIDAQSRYSLAQLQLGNKGQSAAHNVRIEWSEAPIKENGERLDFGVGGTISVLNPGEVSSVFLGEAHDYFTSNRPKTFRGIATFTTDAGAHRSQAISASGDFEWQALDFSSETPRTLHELQKLPAQLEKIVKEIEKLRERLGPDVGA